MESPSSAGTRATACLHFPSPHLLAVKVPNPREGNKRNDYPHQTDLRPEVLAPKNFVLVPVPSRVIGQKGADEDRNP